MGNWINWRGNATSDVYQSSVSTVNGVGQATITQINNGHKVTKTYNINNGKSTLTGSSDSPTSYHNVVINNPGQICDGNGCRQMNAQEEARFNRGMSQFQHDMDMGMAKMNADLSMFNKPNGFPFILLI